MTPAGYALPLALLNRAEAHSAAANIPPARYIIDALDGYLRGMDAGPVPVTPKTATVVRHIELDLPDKLCRGLIAVHPRDMPFERTLWRGLAAHFDAYDADRATATVTARMLPETLARLQGHALHSGCRVDALLRRAVSDYLQELSTSAVPNQMLSLPDVLSEDTLLATFTFNLPAAMLTALEDSAAPDTGDSIADQLAKALQNYSNGLGDAPAPPRELKPFTPNPKDRAKNRRLRL